MPSMSYCMFENTTHEMRQIINTMQEATCMEDLDLSQSEYDSYNYLYRQCKLFIELYDATVFSSSDDC